MSHPNIPMRPEEFPQQKMYVVKGLPPIPEGCDVELLDYESEHGLAGIPKKPTKKSIYLAQVEWAWSPMHNRLDAYYIHKGRTHWLLWSSTLDDQDVPWKWNDHPVACIPVKGVAEQQAAVYLLLEYWKSVSAAFAVDHYHWINETGALSVGQLQAIADVAWTDQPKED